MDNTKILDSRNIILPNTVIAVKTFCEENNIDYSISKNAPAFGCRDAASKRVNGTKLGIALERELKSLLCSCNINGQDLIFAAHMEANRSVCFKSIKKALNLTKKIDVTLASRKVLSEFNMRLGTVNPFLLAVKSKQSIIQIFDSKLIRSNNTMFTNAGDLTWGIEFNVKKLVASIDNAVLYNIAKDLNEILR